MVRRMIFNYQVDSEFVKPNRFLTTDNTVDTDNSLELRSASTAAAPWLKLKVRYPRPDDFPSFNERHFSVVYFLFYCDFKSKNRPKYHVQSILATHR